MKPLIYGYMRVDGDEPDDHLRRIEQELRNLAAVEGFCLAEIFHEYDASHAAFNALIGELNRVDAHHVVVPSLRHLADNQLLRATMLTQLEREAHAHVLAASRR